VERCVRPGGLRIGFAIMLSAALWVSVAAYWIENRNFALDGLRRLVMPCACAAACCRWSSRARVMPLQNQSSAFGWHVAVAVLAYSTLTIAAFHAVLMALQETRLHARTVTAGGWFGGALDQLPALLTMEKLLFRLIWIGFVLLSLTVLSGVVFSEQLFGRALRWDHKNVFALLSWMLFAALLAGRYAGAAGAARRRCASRWPASPRWRWPMSAAASCSKSCCTGGSHEPPPVLDPARADLLRRARQAARGRAQPADARAAAAERAGAAGGDRKHDQLRAVRPAFPGLGSGAGRRPRLLQPGPRAPAAH
jgi:ABC-type uncharacterized transport system permease subunit